MNWQRKFSIATLLTISLIGGDGNFSFAAAGSHYPLWVFGSVGDGMAAGVGADLRAHSAD